MRFNYLGRELIQDIIEEAEELGYSVRLQPRLGIRKYRPDILVKKGGMKIAIEVMASPITLTKIRYLRELPVHRVIICAPSKALSSTADSVTFYADQGKVIICDISEVGQVLARF
jgi:hypothetical protein